jgi:hypothetical protein
VNLPFKSLVAGTDIGITSDSNTVTISYTGTGGGGSALTVQEEGSNVDTDVTTINFTGSSVTASQTSPGTVEVAVTGGGGGSTSEYVIEFPSGASTAGRITSATVPSGWSLATADTISDPQLGTDANDLVITWDAGLGSKYAEIVFMESNTSPSTLAGGRRILASSHTSSSSLYGNSDGTRGVVKTTSVGVNNTLDAKIIVRLY